MNLTATGEAVDWRLPSQEESRQLGSSSEKSPSDCISVLRSAVMGCTTDWLDQVLAVYFPQSGVQRSVIKVLAGL